MIYNKSARRLAIGLAGLAAGLAAAALLVGAEGDCQGTVTSHEVFVNAINFLALTDEGTVSQNYNIRATGEPIQYADVRHYTAEFAFAKPVPAEVRMKVKIMEDRTVLSDPHLGTLEVTIPKNAVQLSGLMDPEFFSYARAIGEAKAPLGTPAEPIEGKFWLGCTKRNKVKGNAGKGDDDHASVYLEIVRPVDSDVGVDLACASTLSNCQSARRTVRCY